MRTVCCFILLLVIVSCKVNEPPIFKKMEDVKVVSMNADSIRLEANVYFDNPNHVGGKLAIEEIQVSLNDIKMAKLASKKFDVPRRKGFKIPLQVSIPSTKFLKNKKNQLLSGGWNVLLSGSVTVRFNGYLKYEFLAFTYTYLIEEEREIKLKF